MHSLEREQYGPFRVFVEYMRSQDYDFVDLETFFACNGRKVIYLSFDDNYRAWFDALQLFSLLGVKATFYVNTNVIRDRTCASDIEAYYDRIDHHQERIPLSSEELKTLSSSGHAIGSHTHSHFLLTSLRTCEARSEISRGKQELEDILGQPVDHFSYPFGMRRHFSEELRHYCRDIGFKTIANAISAMQHSPQTPLHIQRSLWRLDQSLEHNLGNLRVDGALFAEITGRSALGE
jgi:peptidoglycan/xylan/chitin deacetylase (PgdA/CDA1 family)